MKHTEVEKRFQLNNHTELKKRLLQQGARKLGAERQVDVYYNAPHRDFLATDDVSEWLRLREEGGKSSITYKHWLPEGAKVKTHCDEYESKLSDGEAMRKLLLALDFTELVTVEKNREEWQLNDIVIALDAVTDLGIFVELEYKGDASTVAEAHTQIDHCISVLEMDVKPDQDHLGYPHLLIAKQRHEQ